MKLTPSRIAAALLTGAIGCAFIWVAAPYNNFVLKNSYISDTFFPVAGVVFMLVLLLAVNPLLRAVRKTWMLETRQLAIVFAMLLAGAVLPSQGLLRMLPYSVAKTNSEINRSAVLAEAVGELELPASLFPDELGYDVETPVSDAVLDLLPAGESIPWGAWIPPLLSWGVLLLACWLLMVGLGMIVYPQWRESERLPFPLLALHQHLFEDVGEKHLLPPLFRNKLFWIGCGTVMVLYAFNGLNHHTHGKVPAFPMGWNLGAAFTEGAWRHLSWSVKSVGHIYFILVGMAFFMPNRIGFSIWFTVVAYAFYQMIGTAYFPPFHAAVIGDHRNGAMVGVALLVLYLGRRQWARVGRAMVRRAQSDDDRRNRVAGWMFASGCVGMFAWLLWVGVGPLWSLVFVFSAFMVCLLIARIVAETGMPFVRITGLYPQFFMTMMPAGWLTASAIYIGGFIRIIFSYGSRVSATVMTSHIMGLDAKGSPRQQIRLGYLIIIVLMVGLVACGAVHLVMGHYHAGALIEPAQRGVWGSGRMAESQSMLLAWTRNAWQKPPYNRTGHVVFGMGLAAALQGACMAIPKWPLHPIGLLLVGHHYGNNAWASVLIGWSVKLLLVRFGGAAAYRKFRPLFLGLIMGEVFAAITWTLVPVILILLGHDPAEVGHIPLLPT